MPNFLKEKNLLNDVKYTRESWHYITIILKVKFNWFVYKHFSYTQLSFYNKSYNTNFTIT